MPYCHFINIHFIYIVNEHEEMREGDSAEAEASISQEVPSTVASDYDRHP